MEGLGDPVVHVAAQGSVSGSSPQAVDKQGQIAGSNNEDLTMIEGDQRSSPTQQSYSLGQRSSSGHFNSKLESDFENMSSEAQAAISQVSYGRPTATLSPAKVTKKRTPVRRNLLRELASFNKESTVESDPSITGLNLREAHNTRRFVRSLSKIAAGSNTPTPSLDNLDWRSMEDEQLKTMRSNENYDRSTRNTRSPKSGEKEDVRPRVSVRSPRKVSGARQDKDAAKEEAARQRRLKAEGKKGWTIWRARKDEILNLIRDPIFPLLGNPNGEMRQNLESIVPDGFNISMQDDLYVFAPTAATLWNFQKFIAKVEDIIGRKKGFVKIILPDAMKSKYCPPHPTVTAPSAAELLFNESSSSVRPNKTKLDLHKPFESEMVIYRVRMLGGVNVLISEWQEAMRRYEEEIIKGKSEHIFHEHSGHDQTLLTPHNEKEMIAYSKRGSDDMYYTADLPESHSLRHALRLGGPYLRSVHGNRLQGSSLKELGIDRPKIQLTGAQGSSFGLEMTNHAAYSLNYLHRGAPKRWVIIEPEAHKELEELLHPQVEAAAERLIPELSSGFKPPTHPPRCDGFLGHEPLYVPKETLALHAIAHTEIVQYEGEMVITFPFAYSQGSSAGPNVAETIAFGNDRWETIHNSGLYRPCHANCSAPKGPPGPERVGLSEVGQPSPEHVSGQVAEPELQEYNDDDSSLTTPEASGTDAGSDSEDSTWEDPSVNKGKKAQTPTTTKTPIKGFGGFPSEHSAYSPSEARKRTGHIVAGAQRDETSEEDSSMMLDVV